MLDSSVLIHFGRVGALELLKNLGQELLSTHDVYREVVTEGKNMPGTSAIKRFFEENVGIQSVEEGAAEELASTEGLIITDASLVLLAEQTDQVLITNDRLLILSARARGIEAWWLTTVLLVLCLRKIINKAEARRIIDKMIDTGLRLAPEVYSRLVKELSGTESH